VEPHRAHFFDTVRLKEYVQRTVFASAQMLLGMAAVYGFRGRVLIKSESLG